MIQTGICMGIQPLPAYCSGSKDFRRLKEILQKAAVLTISPGTLLTVLIYFGRAAIIGLFIRNASVIEPGSHLVAYQLIMGPFIGIYYLCTNFLQAGGNAAGASVASALRQGALLIPALYLFNSLFQLEGLAAAHPAADGISILFTGALALYYWRKNIL